MPNSAAHGQPGPASRPSATSKPRVALQDLGEVGLGDSTDPTDRVQGERLQTARQPVRGSAFPGVSLLIRDRVDPGIDVVERVGNAEFFVNQRPLLSLSSTLGAWGPACPVFVQAVFRFLGWGVFAELSRLIQQASALHVLSIRAQHELKAVESHAFQGRKRVFPSARL